MKQTLIAVLLLISFFAQGQTTIEYLDINNVKAAFLNRGDMFWKPDSGVAGYEFPKGSGKNSNYAGALWVSGINQATNNLHVSAQTYRQNGNDYWAGPLDNNGMIDSLTSEKWDKIWKVNKSTIDSFINTNLHTLANTPQVILEWPAKGNIYAKGKNGDSITVNKELAPYTDVNNDGIYNPLDGDFPKIKGEQALWWIFNDLRPHTETNSIPIGLEIKAMAYACNSIPALSNAVYLDFKVKSFSTSTYLNTRFSFYNDGDLGYAFDDYIGCDTLRRMGICYNADSIDESGYGTNLTQTGCILLKSPNDSAGYKEPLAGFVFYNNDNTVTGNPENDTDYVYYMNNQWKDGQPFTNACNARNAGNTVKYVYPSELNDPGGYSEVVCHNVPSDRRFLMNTNGFNMIPGSDEYDFSLAFINTPVGSANTDFSLLKAYADTVMQYAEGCSSSFPLNTNNITQTENIYLFPNPANNEIEIRCSDILWSKINSIEIFSAEGKKIMQYDNSANRNHKIDVKRFANGLYFLKIASGEKIYTDRFLKN